MAQRKLEKWREMDSEELYRQLNELNTDYMKMVSMVRAGGSMEKPGKIKELRKQRARLLTIINEKKEQSGE
jgi:large subunit ribosomal protein L29